jgi:hypothetical protein
MAAANGEKKKKLSEQHFLKFIPKYVVKNAKWCCWVSMS